MTMTSAGLDGMSFDDMATGCLAVGVLVKFLGEKGLVIVVAAVAAGRGPDK